MEHGPNGSTHDADTSTSAAAVPPEIEATLSRLSGYRNVRGVMILSRARAGANTGGNAGSNSSGGIIQSTGSVFEGEAGQRYAGALEAVVAATAGAVDAVDEGDELRLMRIRTKRHELILTPDDKYLLVVLQDPE